MPELDNEGTAEKNRNDIGFGSRAGDSRRRRFLNRHGSFNVRRVGLPRLRSTRYFHTFITITWPRLYMLIAAIYLLLNVLFAAAYYACGPTALQGGSATTPISHFADCYFFSVHTLATLGYGTLHPIGLAASLLVTV